MGAREKGSATGAPIPEKGNKEPIVSGTTTVIAAKGCNRPTIVVVCTEKNRGMFRRIWESVFAAAIVMVDYVGQSIADLVAEVMMRDDVPERFILVPAFVCPTSPLTLADLEIVKARSVDGSLSYHTQLPVLLSKDKITETFEVMADTGETDFLAVYHRLAFPGVLPLVVSNAGNFVGYVTRPDPDIEQVEKALSERKFLSCNEAGFSAVEKLLAKRYAG